jgi:hypothetical protein
VAARAGCGEPTWNVGTRCSPVEAIVPLQGPGLAGRRVSGTGQGDRRQAERLPVSNILTPDPR